MFGFLCKNLRVPFRTSSSVVELHFSQNPSILILPPLRYISTDENTNDKHSFTVSYLVSSCGLSPESALSASKHVHFKTLTQPDRVLSLLKNHGFSETHISKLVKKYPKVLTCNPEKTLLPKLDFLQSKGLSSSDIASILFTCPLLLGRSLKNHIIPTFDFLNDLFRSDEMTVAAIKRCHILLYQDLEKTMAIKVNFLRFNEVSESNIITLFYYWPRVFTMSFDKLKKLVKETRDMGFDPSKRTFAFALKCLKSLSKASWENKVDVYKRWNLTQAEILAAFRKQPNLLAASEDKIMGVMDLFVNKLGWESSIIIHRPSLMTFSLEKRLIPRASVLQLIVSKGLVKNTFRSPKIFEYPDTAFQKRFVSCYVEAPEILKLYNEKLVISRKQGSLRMGDCWKDSGNA